jgi:hypothetical protein
LKLPHASLKSRMLLNITRRLLRKKLSKMESAPIEEGIP